MVNFSCVLKGEEKHLEEIKACIIREYVNKGLVKLIDPVYHKKGIHLLTEEQWKEYQRLKRNKERNLIGAGFP